MPTPSKHRHPGTAASGTGTQSALDAAVGSSLAEVVKRAQWLQALDIRLRACLPSSLADHCRLGNVQAGRLVFLVSSSIWKAKLRLHADVLLDAAASAGLKPTALTVKVVTLPPVAAGSAPHKPLSQAARQSLRETADAVTDPQLRDQLLKLASVR